ncbi:MAG: 3-keto-disaccharide hydrolase, partial [Candidatus Acidiferrum sp.]
MKLPKFAFAFLSLALLAAAGHSQAEKSATASQSESPKAFLGRWDLTLKSADHSYPSWLELSEDNGQLKAEMVGRWGNARPLPTAEISKGRLKFVSPKQEEGSKTDLVFEGTLKGRILSGTLNGPDGKTWQWTGSRAPSLRRTAAPMWAAPIHLFTGKDLTGWHESTPGASPPWKVENGSLITPGNGPELINNSKFEDFKLHVEFNCGEKSNSGVYLRGRYELQIETNSEQEPPSHHTGGIYGFIAPSPELPRKAGEWQTFDITLVGRTVTVVQNGQTIIDHKEIPGITGGALDSHEGLPGPIYLQGSEEGHVSFRNIV